MIGMSRGTLFGPRFGGRLVAPAAFLASLISEYRGSLMTVRTRSLRIVSRSGGSGTAIHPPHRQTVPALCASQTANLLSLQTDASVDFIAPGAFTDVDSDLSLATESHQESIVSPSRSRDTSASAS